MLLPKPSATPIVSLLSRPSTLLPNLGPHHPPMHTHNIEWPHCTLCQQAGHWTIFCPVKDEAEQLRHLQEATLQALNSSSWSNNMLGYDQLLQRLAISSMFLEWSCPGSLKTEPGSPSNDSSTSSSKDSLQNSSSQSMLCLNCPFPNCTQTLTDLHHFIQHCRAHGKPTGTVVCPFSLCGQAYLRMGRLFNHIRSCHVPNSEENRENLLALATSDEEEGNKKRKAEELSKTSIPYTPRTDTHSKVSTIDQADNPLAFGEQRCPVKGCARRFALPRALVCHLSGHFTQGAVTCVVCNISSEDYKTFKAHVVTHGVELSNQIPTLDTPSHPTSAPATTTITTTKSIITPMGVSGKSSERLVTSPEDVRSDFSNVCPEKDCGFTFPTSKILAAHVRLHPTLRQTLHITPHATHQQYRCGYGRCGEIFKSAGQLRKHIWMHKSHSHSKILKGRG